MKYLGVDCEFGGLAKECSLLTMAMVLYDHNFNELDHIHYFIKPDNGLYVVEAGGLAVNNINIVAHNNRLDCKTYREASTAMYQNLYDWSNCGKEKLYVTGKQVAGDVRRIQDTLISKSTWENFCSYHLLDVSSVYQFLKSLGLYKNLTKGSLSDLLAHYGIDASQQHDALADVRYTVEVLRRMRNEVNIRFENLLRDEL